MTDSTHTTEFVTPEQAAEWRAQAIATMDQWGAYAGTGPDIIMRLCDALAASWEAALDHVWALSDPVCTIDTFDGERPVVVRFDIEQAKSENPYSRDAETNGDKA